MNYIAKLKAEIYKSLIDTKVVELSQYMGTYKKELNAILENTLAIDNKSWEYLREVLNKVQPFICSETIEKKLGFDWGASLLNSSENTQWPFLVMEEMEIEEYEDEECLLELKYYPKESHPALKQEYFWICQDADITGCWTTEGGVQKIYHAHPEGFWILGEDPLDFLEQSMVKIMA